MKCIGHLLWKLSQWLIITAFHFTSYASIDLLSKSATFTVGYTSTGLIAGHRVRHEEPTDSHPSALLRNPQTLNIRPIRRLQMKYPVNLQLWMTTIRQMSTEMLQSCVAFSLITDSCLFSTKKVTNCSSRCNSFIR